MQQLFPLMMVGKLGEDTVLLASLVFIEHQSHSQKPCLFTLRNFTHMQRRDMYSRSFHMLYIRMQTRCLSLVSWIQKRKKNTDGVRNIIRAKIIPKNPLLSLFLVNSLLRRLSALQFQYRPLQCYM